MGVHGLWKLLEPSGKPVPVETLENKVLAVDVSIWLHQLVKGYQDSGGGSVANAHLLGLFHRICKLLFFKVKPIFVFDGGVPLLKKQTIASRRAQRSKADEIAVKLREQILKNLVQQRAVGHASGTKQPSIPQHLLSQREQDMFELPPVPSSSKEDEEDKKDIISSDEEESMKPFLSTYELQRIDVNSEEFKSLPADMRHDLLSELKELRKQNSWRKIHEMPENLGDFSSFQLGRLMKRRHIQVSLDEAAKEMGGRTLSLAEMQQMFEEDGIIADAEVSQRIASDASTRFVYIPGGKIPSSLLLTEPEPGSSKKADYEETAKEPVLPLPKRDEDVEVMKMIEEIEDEYSEESEVDYISMKSESPERRETVYISDDELSQAQILKIMEDSKEASNLYSAGPSKREIKFNREHSSSVEAELEKMFSEEAKPKMKALNNLADSDAKVDDSILEVFDDIPCETLDTTLRKKNILSKVLNSCGRKPESALENGVGIMKSPKKERVSVSEYDIISPKKSPKKERVSFSESDSTKKSPKKEIFSDNANSGSSSDEFVEVDEQNEMISIYQKSKLDEFVEENIKKEKEKPCVEIVIDPSKCQVDSLFADVFSSITTSGTTGDMTATGISEIVDSSNESLVSVSPDIVENESEVMSVNKFTSDSDKPLNSFNKSSNSDVKLHDNSSIDSEILNSATDVKEKKTIDSVAKSPSTTRVEAKNNEDIQVKSSEYSKTSGLEEVTSKVNNSMFADVEESNESVSPNLVDLNEESVTLDKGTEENGVQAIDEIQSDVPPSSIESNGDGQEVDEIPEISPSEPLLNDQPGPSSREDALSQHFDAETLRNLQTELEIEQDQLLIEKGKQERLASNITDQMNSEAQELLKIFGIPFIIAPMEAEAQCAFLDSAMLTEGTITDDSDIWLFGGRKVYKNFFDQKKHVLQYRISDIHHFFKISRTQLIQLALLVGSDYTPGLKGVGPVTALEILSFFKESAEEEQHRRIILSGLEKFKEWMKKPEQMKAQCVFANKVKNLELHDGFPNSAVVDAYLCPEVDESQEGFSWGTPDLKLLEHFVWQKFGWSKSKFDQLMSPVMKKISERTNQNSLDRYFQAVPKFNYEGGRVSKRVQRAIDHLSGAKSSDGSDSTPSGPKKKKTETGENDSVPESNNVTPFDKKRKARPKKDGGEPKKRLQKNKTEAALPVDPPSTSQTLPILPDESDDEKNSSDIIPQREKDLAEKAKRKLDAVKIFQASKKTRGGKRRKNLRRMGKIEKSTYLSESSDDD